MEQSIKKRIFLITISSKQYKIVKFINQNSNIQALKVFAVSHKNQQFINVLKNQLENIQDYLIRRYELTSRIGAFEYIEINQKSHPDLLVIKVNTAFSQFPNLSDFYRKQALNPDSRIVYNDKTYLYYFEQMFQLIVRGGGIDYYFYTPNNVFICPPKKQNLMALGYLRLNLSSTAGLKVIFELGNIPKDQFIEIFPCLPPNIYTLLKQKTKQALRELDKLIKIRSLAFLILTFILKRVPYLIQENFQTLVDPQSQIIHKLVESSPQRMKMFFDIEGIRLQIQKVEKLTKIELKRFFLNIFVNCENTDEINWPWVYETLFQKNVINLKTYEMTKEINMNRKNQRYRNNYEIYSKINEQLWKIQKKKQFYISRHFYLPKRPQKGMVYFLVKINQNFHLLTEYLHYIQYLKSDMFSADGNNIVIKLMNIFNEMSSKNIDPILYNFLKQAQLISDESQFNHENQSKQQNQMIQKKHQDSTINPANLSVLPQSYKQDLINPFSLKNEHQVKIIEQYLSSGVKKSQSLKFPSGPVEFFENIYTYIPKIEQNEKNKNKNKNNELVEQKYNKDSFEQKINILTMKNNYDTLIKFTSNLWIH